MIPHNHMKSVREEANARVRCSFALEMQQLLAGTMTSSIVANASYASRVRDMMLNDSSICQNPRNVKKD